ncbi:hypothetical protein GCM10011613_36270 [Cellvibrio zantedeschiae]|uniref:Uncharacterized protein n=1 Tax=Cellvibrio zantedeschiae TaxID=1237077 RepID=A0ABQ3BF30_9GAMM|nr:hypothetical protein GCM10011613_36270 [Cellvibrio zantedeschiae]
MEVTISIKPPTKIVSTKNVGLSSDNGRGKSVNEINEKVTMAVATIRNVRVEVNFVGVNFIIALSNVTH